MAGAKPRLEVRLKADAGRQERGWVAKVAQRGRLVQMRNLELNLVEPAVMARQVQA